MTQALPAETVLVQLAAVERRETISILADLGPAERDVARTLLAEIPPDGRIAVASFVADVRRRARDQAMAEAQSRPSGAAWRFAVSSLMSDEQLAAFRQFVRDGTEPNKAARRALESESRHTTDDAEPDPDPELDDDTEKPRRSVPRVRIRGAQGAQGADDTHELAPDPAPDPEPTVTRPRPFLGGRLFGPHTDDRPYGQPIDYDHHAESFPPPWLLSDGGDETDDDEPDDNKQGDRHEHHEWARAN